MSIPKPARIKRADQVGDAVKRWIVQQGLRAGDKLPQEKELMSHFESSRGTIREALRTLEVQGLVRIRTGPGGGATIAEVPPELPLEMLRNYLHFAGIDSDQLYELRRVLEPELAANVADCLTDEDIKALERTLEVSRERPPTPAGNETARLAEFEFHNIMARACKNPLLRLWCLFVNQMLADLVIYKKVYRVEQDNYRESNLQHHMALISAFKEKNKKKARSQMLKHMRDSESYMTSLEAIVDQDMLSYRSSCC